MNVEQTKLYIRHKLGNLVEMIKESKGEPGDTLLVSEETELMLAIYTYLYPAVKEQMVCAGINDDFEKMLQGVQRTVSIATYVKEHRVRQCVNMVRRVRIEWDAAETKIVKGVNR
jgi:hypothetical protein